MPKNNDNQTTVWTAITDGIITSNRFILEPFTKRQQVIDAYDQAHFGRSAKDIGFTAAALAYRIAEECKAGRLHMAAIKKRTDGPAVAIVSLVVDGGKVYATADLNKHVLMENAVSMSSVQVAMQMWSNAINNHEIPVRFQIVGNEIKIPETVINEDTNERSFSM